MATIACLGSVRSCSTTSQNGAKVSPNPCAICCNWPNSSLRSAAALFGAADLLRLITPALLHEISDGCRGLEARAGKHGNRGLARLDRSGDREFFKCRGRAGAGRLGEQALPCKTPQRGDDLVLGERDGAAAALAQGADDLAQ